jgi:hypothetical protein
MRIENAITLQAHFLPLIRRLRTLDAGSAADGRAPFGQNAERVWKVDGCASGKFHFR